MTKPDFLYEQEAIKAHKGNKRLWVIGVDEAGRGPWAGPVTAGAAWINPKIISQLPQGIDDSKKLSPPRRAAIWHELQELAKDGDALRVATASVNAQDIDKNGIVASVFAAMEQAVLQLNCDKNDLHALLVDGIATPPFEALKAKQVQAIKKGDAKSLSIAIAAIAAKQTRDNYMRAIHKEYPLYDWQNNMGYGTKTHGNALAKHGVSPYHRMSFKPIAKIANTT